MKDTDVTFVKRIIVWGILVLIGVFVFKLSPISILYGYIIGVIHFEFIQ